MFTGIVEATGEVVAVEGTDEGRRIRVAAPFSDELEHGQSVAISGACLTVEAFDAESFELFLSEETLDRTYLDRVAVGDIVNLERALPADGRFDGHFVQGHVDGVAEVSEIERLGDDWTFGFSLPAELRRYVEEQAERLDMQLGNEPPSLEGLFSGGESGGGTNGGGAGENGGGTGDGGGESAGGEAGDSGSALAPTAEGQSGEPVEDGGLPEDATGAETGGDDRE